MNKHNHQDSNKKEHNDDYLAFPLNQVWIITLI